MNHDATYWDGFYKNTDSRLSIPSQFATFVATEFLGSIEFIIDLGCGNGRDAIFFSSLGFKVIGVDSSGSAIESIKAKSPVNSVFFCSDISDKNLPLLIEESTTPFSSRLIYSRFFLHAISDDQELSLWRLVDSLTKINDVFAIEFRTSRDEMLAKVTAEHYRRFVNPIDVIDRAGEFGFKCIYLTEGFGYAKYKADDAHVARLLLKKFR